MSIDWKKIRSYEGSQQSAFEELVCQIAHNKFAPNTQNKYVRVKAPDGGVESYLTFPNGDEFGWQAKYFFDIQNSQFDQIEKSFKTVIDKHPNLKKYYVCCPIDKQDPRIEGKQYLQDRWHHFVNKCKKIADDKGITLEIEYWGAFELNSELQKEYNTGVTKFWFGCDEFSNNWFNEQVNGSIKNLGARYSTELNFENHEIASYFDFMIKNSKFCDDIFNYLQETFKILNKIYSELQSKQFNTKNQIVNKVEVGLQQLQDFWITISENNPTELDILKIENSLQDIFDQILPLLTSKYIIDENYRIDSLLDELGKAIYDITQKCYYLADNPYLIIHGKAGIGKSHLLGDIANNLIKNNKKCVFLLGQRFTNETHPWTQILKDELRLCCNEDEFLGILNTIGQAQQERVLFIIDALNEGKGCHFWKDTLASFIAKFSKYPWVGLVLSIRSEYKQNILANIQRDIETKRIMLIEHMGLSSNIVDATEFFFNYHQIPLPTEPLLINEFSNPLFLKIYCEYRKSTPKEVSSLLISEVFREYFKTINKKISEKLGYRVNLNLVSKVLNDIAEAIFMGNGHSINYLDTTNIINQNYSAIISADIFLQELLAENLLTAQMDNATDTEYLHFTFERFLDYLTAQYICETLTTKKDFKNNLELLYNNLLYKDRILSSGVVGVLSFLIPIKYGFELYEVIDLKSINYSFDIVDLFIESLYWRNNDNFSLDKNRLFINGAISHSNHYLLRHFLNLNYQVAGKENHPLNAEKLHLWLSKFSLAERDSFWTIEINRGFENIDALQNIILWGKNRSFSDSLSDNSRFLLATALSWALSTTNIALRDDITIALARLLQNHLSVASDILKRFSSVNDPYIVERVFAASYGAVLSSQKTVQLQEICTFLLNNFFSKDEIYPNILVRDYAKNIVEYAHLHSIITLTDDENDLIHPPYSSSFPKSLPSNDDIDTQFNNYNKDTSPEYYRSIDIIFHSMATEYGRGMCGYGDFGRYTFEAKFRNWKGQVDINLLSNYAIQLIFEKYGYNPELHGKFDRYSISNDRSRNTIERIGKKYQWIAMYEAMARVSDNIKMIAPSSRYGSNPQQIWYNGSVEPCLRDIDPSFIPPSNDKRMIHTPDYDDWDNDYEKWTISKNNLINIRELLSLEYDNAQWCSLQRYVDYNPRQLDDNSCNGYQNLWYRVQACLVHNKDFENIIRNIQNKSFMNNWMPQPVEHYNNIFYGEYYWSPLFSVYNNNYYSHSNWQNITHNKQIIGKAHSCSNNYIMEGIKNSRLATEVYVPSELIYKTLELSHDIYAGSWLNQNNEVVLFDAGLYGNSKNNLLIRFDELMILEKLLDCRIIWTVLSEKVAMHDMVTHTKNRLTISGVYYLENGIITGNDYFFIN
ncbi:MULTISPECIES: NACHT domain-containing protein [Pasteurellaceae]|uniref:NACHT domain-containing protein n=1 Tax=Pasteurella atlantica TaxID=2827233 RepID=A0AAW8CTB9_9PAST|nr:NACHT domain-containing protein [Pasteurella atlantica]MBR0574049.1 NACHT domain-containing protein [Pasteurella atlantica]MDP8040011.1 NACHT domain-containing protein [Pasteurella atlantica]MDP8042125.1 NACHT domain-containing protein [Pasteurella atlantica]MDP8044239.1 NACHT domain-containing protein [Pasteurella atlantica]MDP8046324.1 NACHT domain-containing protein [Pasteurella atlantica]